MFPEFNFSTFGLGCIAWTVLLVLVSYIYIARRQSQLFKKINETNEQNRKMAEENKNLMKCTQNYTAKEESDSDEADDASESEDEKLPLVNSDDIVLEAKSDKAEMDPFEYCEHIQGEVKRIKQKITQKKYGVELTPTQVAEEREVQRKQLEAIFKLMAEKEGKFGVDTVDDVRSQMKMYL